MMHKSFTVPAQSSEEAQHTLNAFCARHRVVAVEEQFVPMGGMSYWAICVSIIEGGRTHAAGPSAAGFSAAGSRCERVDYREALGERESLPERRFSHIRYGRRARRGRAVACDGQEEAWT